MEVEMQVEIPMPLYKIFLEQADARNCTVEDIVLETIRKFIGKER